MLLGLSSAGGENELEIQLVAGSVGADAGGPGDGGVAHGPLLAEFAEKIHRGTVENGDRAAIVEAVGDAGLVDAVAICANFNMMVRIADGTGTPLDAGTVPVSEQLRQELDLDDLTSRRLADAT